MAQVDDKVQAGGDADPAETTEWVESLEYVLRAKGPARASYLLSVLDETACRNGVELSFTINTPYINTIPADQQPVYPGNREIERRIKSIIRWNAMAMVVRANKHHHGIGGHISTYASAATLYEVAFNHFFRGKSGDYSGDQIYFQGHASPGIYARAFLEGRLSEQQLENFRHELSRRGRPVVLSAPLADARLLAVSHRLDGPRADHGHLPGPLQPLSRPIAASRIASKSHVWAFLGDGECDEPESLGAITLASREKLDNLIFVINCNLQRLDGPVRGNGKIIQELEAAFRGAGWNVIKVIWGGDWDPLLAKDKNGLLVQRMGEVVDGEFQKYSVMPGSYIREHFFGKYPELEELVEPSLGRAAQQAAPRRPRSGKGLRRLQGGRRMQGQADRHPGPHHQGLRPGRSRRRPQRDPPPEEAERGRAARVPHPLRHSDLRRGRGRGPVLQAAGRQRRDEVSARAPRSTGRLRADAQCQGRR